MRAALALAISAAAFAAPAARAEDAGAWRLGEAVSAPDWLTLSGSFRARYETLENQFRPGLTGSDQLVTLRTTLFGEARKGPLRIGAELFDSRAYLGDAGGSVGTGEVDAVELPQAYVGARFDDAFGQGAHADLQLGRFTMDIGSRRLVGRNSFRNTTNAFTGAKFDWASAEGAQLTLFYTLPQLRLPEDKAAILDNEVEWDKETRDLAFWGVFYGAPKLGFGARGEAFVFGLDEEDSAARPTRNRHLVTPGLRIVRGPKKGAWDFEIEAGVQRGEVRASASPADVKDLDVEASYAHVTIGRQWEGPWSPRLAFEYDFASGDADPGDDKYGRFDALYGPRRPDFGPADIYGALGRSNISAPGFRFEAKPNVRWDGFVSYRALWLAEARDAFASTGVRDASGASGTFAGHQVEARARYWITPNALRLELGGAVLIDGAFLKHAPNATGEGDTLHGYADITWTF